MKKYYTILLLFFFQQSACAQNDTVVPDVPIIPADTSYWTNSMLLGLNGTQSTFFNWSAGGRNSLSLLGFIDASAKYQKGDIKWTNDLKLALGGMTFLDSEGSDEGLQKTDDRIDFSSAFGYEFKKKWFYTVMGGFKTQALDGFVFPNDSIRASTFMAPAYINLALGIEYAPSKNFSIFLSPLALKITIVNDQVLSNAGAFGVTPAVLDTAGNVLTAGKRIRYEPGAYFKLLFAKELAKNIEMKARLELFSNYAHNPQNIDINAETIFTFKVNKWFSTSLQWNLLYDDDIDVMDNQGRTGPRTQFKSVLGLGISHTLKNQ
jgi:hypothetical protein